MASEVEDPELFALRTEVLATLKTSASETKHDDDEDDLEALREAALLSRKKLQKTVIQNNLSSGNRGNSYSFKRRMNNSFHSHNRNGNHKRNLERSNLIVINPVPIITPKNDNESVITNSKLLLSNNLKNVIISDDSSSPKLVYSKSKAYNRFSRFESESYSDSDSDSSECENERSDDFICSDEKETLQGNDFSSVETNKQDTNLFNSKLTFNESDEQKDAKLSSQDNKLQMDFSNEKSVKNLMLANSFDKISDKILNNNTKENSPIKPDNDLKPSIEKELKYYPENLSINTHKNEHENEKLLNCKKEKTINSNASKNTQQIKTSERKEISFNTLKDDSSQCKYLGWDLRMHLNCNNRSRSPSSNSSSSQSQKSLSQSRSPSPVLKSVLSVVKQIPLEKTSRSERKGRNNKESSNLSRRRRDVLKSQRDVFCVISPRRSEKSNDDTKKCASSTEELPRKLPVYMRLGVSVKNVHKKSKRESSSSPSEDQHHKEKRIKIIKCSTSDCEKQRKVTFSRSDDERCYNKHHKENSIIEHKKRSTEKKSGKKEKRSHLHRKR